MLVWKTWPIYTESMIVVKGTEAHETDSACARVISWVREQVILGEGGGVHSNSSICEILHASEWICLIEGRR